MNTKTQVTRSGHKTLKFRYLQSIASVQDEFDLKENIDVTPSKEHKHTTKLPNQSLAESGKSIYRVMGAYDTGWQIKGQSYDLKEDVARFPIGIRDIYFGSTKYAEKGQLVTKPFMFPGSIDKIQIYANTFIPANFDRNKSWINFFVVIGSEKLPILPVNNLYGAAESIPNTIYINRDPDPEENMARRFDSENDVNELRASFTIRRPSENENSSPILKGFRFKVGIL